MSYYSPVVQSRRYRVSYNGQVLRIERTWNDLFDFMGTEQLKRSCIAKGNIRWEGDAARLDLVVRLSDSVIFFEWVYWVFLFGLSVFMLCRDWRFSLAVSLFTLINVIVWRVYSKSILRAFLEELEQDIDYFKN